jgi:hypothetical protein
MLWQLCAPAAAAAQEHVTTIEVAAQLSALWLLNRNGAFTLTPGFGARIKFFSNDHASIYASAAPRILALLDRRVRHRRRARNGCQPSTPRADGRQRCAGGTRLANCQ